MSICSSPATAVHDFGAGDLLEIVPQGGGETRLLPFTSAVAPQVDIAAGRIVLDPPGEIEAEPEGGGDRPLNR
jgi:16S rRNA processing protein RimM